MSSPDIVVVISQPVTLSARINVGPRGPTGPAGTTVDVGTRASPSLVTTSIPVTTDEAIRIFIAGSGGPVSNPTITHLAGNKTVILFGTDNTNTVSIAKSTSNFELSGTWYARSGSILKLEWDGASKYTEDYRNDI